MPHDLTNKYLADVAQVRRQRDALLTAVHEACALYENEPPELAATHMYERLMDAIAEAAPADCAGDDK